MMSAPLYRVTRSGDEPQLLDIWSKAYGGDVDCASLYFNRYYQPGEGVVAEVDGRLCSSIYLIDGYRLHIPGKRAYACTYLYALGTPEEFRGKGYGGKTIWKSGVVGYDRGADYVCFLPASPSLYRWYEGCIGTRTVFSRREFSISAGQPQAGTLTPLSPEDYQAKREILLTDTPHVEQPVKAVSLQGDYCRLYGGGLYQVEACGHWGLCAFDREENELTFRELLYPQGDVIAAVQAVLTEEHAASALVRTPVFWHTALGQIIEDNVLVPGGYTFPKTENPPYWGFSMD